jgi:antitoxin VapB
MKLFIVNIILIVTGYTAYPHEPVKEVANRDELINEIDIKLQRVKSFMNQHGLSGMLLTKTNNFSWMTAGIGDNHIVLTSEAGVASILILNNGKKYILANETEIPHILQEEVNGLGYESIGWGWWENRDIAEVAKKLAGNGSIGCDVPMNGLKYVEKEFNTLRF